MDRFRPQQGLTIMNKMEYSDKEISAMFPSPKGVNYYELTKKLTGRLKSH